MDRSIPGLPVHRQVPELTQTSIESVMPSNTSSSVVPFSPWVQSFPASRSFPKSWLYPFRWPKYWSFSLSFSPSNEYSGLISFRMDWLDLLLVQWTIKSSPTPQFKSISSSALSFLYSLTLTSIHDHRKNHSFDYSSSIPNCRCSCTFLLTMPQLSGWHGAQH